MVCAEAWLRALFRQQLRKYVEAILLRPRKAEACQKAGSMCIDLQMQMCHPIGLILEPWLQRCNREHPSLRLILSRQPHADGSCCHQPHAGKKFHLRLCPAAAEQHALYRFFPGLAGLQNAFLRLQQLMKNVQPHQGLCGFQDPSCGLDYGLEYLQQGDCIIAC